MSYFAFNLRFRIIKMNEIKVNSIVSYICMYRNFGYSRIVRDSFIDLESEERKI